MNIYDEALNSNKKIRMRYESIVGDFYKEDYDNIDNALERAKKEHELLEWYRESWKTMRDGRLEKKIEKLEKELEEMD